MIRQPDPAGAPLEIAGPGRDINFLSATGTEKKHGMKKFTSEKAKRCTDEVQYRGRVKMAPPQRSQIWDIVYMREDRDDTVGFHKAKIQGAAGLQGGDRVNFRVPEIHTPRRGRGTPILPVENILHHYAGPQADSPYGDGRQNLQRSASAPPEAGERTPPFDPYTRRGIVGCPRPVRPPARMGAFA
jgi:hypothetical protein